MKKILGILALLIFVCIFTASYSDAFTTAFNIENLVRRTSLFGIISIGAAFVIITGGIDLSIGSMICLIGCLLPHLLTKVGLSVPVSLLIVFGISLAIGLMHGLLVTKMKLQPFVVTLCGLLLYRGMTRGIVQDQTQGFGLGYESLKFLSQGLVTLPGTEIGVPVPCFFLLGVMIVSAIFLNMTIYGRYFLALGRNEDAARYSGINTDRMVILAYVICGLLSGLGGVLFVLDVGSAQPVDFGNFYELYAIAAAVLGGCSLRGGEGSILGVIIGTAVMQVLKNSITLIDEIRIKLMGIVDFAIPVSTNIEFAIIGAVILSGVIVDELVKRFVAKQRARAQLKNAASS